MDYQKVYNQIVERAKSENRVKGGDAYYEAHHIIPRCLGGKNSHTNMVLLTAREHFICHWLLHNLYPTNSRIFYAFNMMGRMAPNRHNVSLPHNFNVSSRIYEYLRIKFAEFQSNRIVSEETRKKMSEFRKGTKVSDEVKKKMSIAHKNRTHRSGYKLPQEHIENVRKANIGKKRTEEFKQSHRLKFIGKVRPKKICPFCGKEGGVGNMERWHFENCKNYFTLRNCKNCNKEFSFNSRAKNRKFCTKSCSSTYNNLTRDYSKQKTI